MTPRPVGNAKYRTAAGTITHATEHLIWARWAAAVGAVHGMQIGSVRAAVQPIGNALQQPCLTGLMQRQTSAG